MFVIGEVFADLVVHAGPELDSLTRAVTSHDLQLGGAGHVARLLRWSGAKLVRLLVADDDYCEFMYEIPDSANPDHPLRLTLVEDGKVRRYIRPAYRFARAVVARHKCQIPDEAFACWANDQSDWTFICSHDYVDIRLTLDQLKERCDRPRTYFVSGGPELLHYKFNGRCYFFVNRRQLRTMGYNFCHFDHELDDADALNDRRALFTELWQRLRAVNEVAGLFITMDQDGVITLGIRPETPCLARIQPTDKLPHVVWYTSRVKHLVDPTGCGDAFMVGYSMNMEKDEPVRAALMAAKQCAHFAGTIDV